VGERVLVLATLSFVIQSYALASFGLGRGPVAALDI